MRRFEPAIQLLAVGLGHFELLASRVFGDRVPDRAGELDPLVEGKLPGPVEEVVLQALVVLAPKDGFSSLDLFGGKPPSPGSR